MTERAFLFRIGAQFLEGFMFEAALCEFEAAASKGHSGVLASVKGCVLAAIAAGFFATLPLVLLTLRYQRLGTLRWIGPDAWVSPSGLRYVGRDPKGLNRVQHVLRHTADVPSRATHGVFDKGPRHTLALIDEAWMKIQKEGIKGVTQGRRTEYVVDMMRHIGYEGGRVGSKAGYPALTKLLIVVEDAVNVITAFPVR
jgi:hypothetical protein